MTDDDLRDELVQVLWHRAPAVSMRDSIVAADAILASGLLDRIRADVWDECCAIHDVQERHRFNPYRQPGNGQRIADDETDRA